MSAKVNIPSHWHFLELSDLQITINLPLAKNGPAHCITYSIFLLRRSSETDNQERLAAYEFCIETDHCCFVTLLPGAAYFPKDISENIPVVVEFHLKNTTCSIVYAILVATTGSRHCHWRQHIFTRLLNSDTLYTAMFAMQLGNYMQIKLNNILRNTL
jgi:hypothetical protein